MLPAAHAGAAAIAIVSCLVLLWIGIVGDGARQIYFVEIAIALAGAIVAWFRPEALARAMFVTAGFQLLVTCVAGIDHWAPEAGGRLWLNGLLAAPWLLAGWLFRSAEAPRAA